MWEPWRHATDPAWAEVSGCRCQLSSREGVRLNSIMTVREKGDLWFSENHHPLYSLKAGGGGHLSGTLGCTQTGLGRGLSVELLRIIQWWECWADPTLKALVRARRCRKQVEFSLSPALSPLALTQPLLTPPASRQPLLDAQSPPFPSRAVHVGLADVRLPPLWGFLGRVLGPGLFLYCDIRCCDSCRLRGMYVSRLFPMTDV